MTFRSIVLILLFFAAISLAIGFYAHSELTLLNFLTEFFAGLIGVLLAFTLDGAIEEKKKKHDKADLLRDLHFELQEIRKNLTGRGNLFFPDIWESAISSGQIRLLDSHQVRGLTSIYHNVKGSEYEAIRVRDLAEKIRLGKAKGQSDAYLKGSVSLWGKYSAILIEREKKLSTKIEDIFKEKWWNNIS